MLTRRTIWILALGAVVGAALAGCGQRDAGSTTPQVKEETFSLTPATIPVQVAFLTGELRDLKVSERVEQGTGKVVELPKLTAMLKLKNSSADQAARLLGGKINYVDAGGKPIALDEGRGDTSFKVSAYQTDRLDPGMETSQTFEIPFPSAALKERQLRDVRMELDYIPTPYREGTVDIQVSLAR